jgi:hypothetical protein
MLCPAFRVREGPQADISQTDIRINQSCSRMAAMDAPMNSISGLVAGGMKQPNALV